MLLPRVQKQAKGPGWCIGEFDTRLDAAELEIEQALSLHASRSPGGRYCLWPE